LPGYLKVSGSQKTVASPYIKVGGTWKKAAAGYVKVSGAWKQWYASSVVDDFNRANASTLGTASDGFTTWTTTRGAWGIASNVASSSTTASSYALATVPSPTLSANYTVSVDVPANAGPGVAFWVTDANNWWGATTNITSTTSYSCPSGGTYNSSTGNCDVSSSYTATMSYTKMSSAYDCGYTTVGATSTNPVVSAFTPCPNAGCNSGNGYYCSGTTCYDSTPVYSCPSGYTLSGTTCYKYTSCCAGAYYSSDPGGLGRGAGCYAQTYTCPSGGTLNVGDLRCYSTTSYTATSTTTTTYSVKVIQAVANVISTKATYSSTGRIASLKVNTSGNNVTVSTYLSAGLGGTATTNMYTATSPTTTSVAGIVKGVSTSSQGSTLDNFSVK